ncbi:glycosyltransferase family 4 protein [Metabacillus halosaccharovorans]|uniref:glycosyltransferase family 4 protein n=1 Tax=Metabacillus halosaccharovorans TaxID=930124 RepID=UPI001C1FAE60|nr:glycosyltransferase family 4 protein [Metabacillus halosaccharovorans]MBU7591450.1 glycosyltransferase family 4 protein [Metabacillus halosaccharovorans]
MKILMICTEKLPVPPVLGGAIQTYIAGSLPHLRNKHDITVLGVNDPSLPDQETIDGIKYVRVPGKILEIYREEVVRYVEANQFDLIHIFNRPRLVLPVRQVSPNAKIVLSMHNDMFSPEKINPEEAKAVINEVTNIITISNYVGNVIRELYPEAASKLHTIYSGVDTDRFLPGHHQKMQKIRQELRSANGLENKTVLLFAGRLSNNKGVDRLVRALPELSKKYKDLALVIVGSKWFSQNDVTDYVAYVRALANKLPIPVVTTGFVAPSEIQNWFAAADLFVCTSVWQEPLARVHYEAMAAGLPIVTTARGGNAEVISLNDNGLVVENPENPSDFVEKISQILSDRSLMKRMGEKGREYALSLYQWDRVASNILEVWRKSFEAPLSVSQPEVLPTIELPINDTHEPLQVQSNDETVNNPVPPVYQSAKIEEKDVPKTETSKEENTSVNSKKEQLRASLRNMIKSSLANSRLSTTEGTTDKLLQIIKADDKNDMTKTEASKESNETSKEAKKNALKAALRDMIRTSAKSSLENLLNRPSE